MIKLSRQFHFKYISDSFQKYPYLYRKYLVNA